MKRSKLKYLALHITDGEHTSVTDDANGNCFLLSNKNIVDSNIVITNTDRKINQQTLDRLNKRTKLDIGDVVVSTVGSIGKTAIIKEKPNYDFQRSVGIIKCNEEQILPEYLLYYLNLPSVQKRLIKLSKGAIQKCLFINDLEELLIDHPETIEEQKKIVSSLIEIDQQIQRNNDMVHKLQVLIHTKYSSTFESKNVPNGHIKNICLLPSGFSFKPEMYCPNGNYKLVTIKNVNDIFVNTEKTDKLSTIPNSMKKYCNLSVGDILMSLTGNVGRISIVTEKNNLLNQRVSVLKCDEKYKTYIYALLNSQKYQIIMQNISRGTSQKNLSPIDVENLAIFIPDNIEEFYNETTLYFNQMISIQQNTQSLLNLKSNILPLLINNQLTNMQCFSIKKGGTVDVT